jgi:Glycosyltransferase family 92
VALSSALQRTALSGAPNRCASRASQAPTSYSRSPLPARTHDSQIRDSRWHRGENTLAAMAPSRLLGALLALAALPAALYAVSPFETGWKNTVAICAIMRKEHTDDVREWLQYHRCAPALKGIALFSCSVRLTAALSCFDANLPACLPNQLQHVAAFPGTSHARAIYERSAVQTPATCSTLGPRWTTTLPRWRAPVGCAPLHAHRRHAHLVRALCRYIGVDRVFLYDNNEDGGAQRAALADFAADGFLHLATIAGRAQQLPAYQHCVSRYAGDFAWLAALDVDEVLVVEDVQAKLLPPRDSLKAVLAEFRFFPGAPGGGARASARAAAHAPSAHRLAMLALRSAAAWQAHGCGSQP